MDYTPIGATFWELVSELLRMWPQGAMKGNSDDNETAVANRPIENIKSDDKQATVLHNLKPKPPGRKPDPINEEVYQMILDGKDKDTAFASWCEKKGIIEFVTAKDRKRDRDAFNKAMKRAKHATK